MADVKTILISGAGVAGPTLAWWLAHHGFKPTVVERAPAIRDGGQAVDFRGPAHMGVLQKMGVLDEIRARQTHMGATTFVDANDRPLLTLSAEFLGGEVEILRGDLGQVLHAAGRDRAEYIFDDTITALRQDADGVDVTFEHAPPRRFDLVIGADGLHSAVRRLAFGAEERFIRNFGYSVAICTVPNVYGIGLEGRIHGIPGRAAGLFGARGGAEVRASLYFTSGANPPRRDVAAQKAAVADAFAGMGWHALQLIEAMHAAPDFYFDTISQVRMDQCSAGRIALVGDAGYGGTLGGMGTGLAVVAAYVLAGELAASPDDHAAAFARYAAAIGDYARSCQKGAASVGRFMAPKTALGIWFRNTALNAFYHLPGKGLMESMASDRAEGIVLKDYGS